MVKARLWRAVANVCGSPALRILLNIFILLCAVPSPALASSLDARPLVSFMPQTSRFVLDATGLITSSSPVTYQWTLTSRPAGSAALITGSSLPVAQVSGDTAGPYTVELTVIEAGIARAPIVINFNRDNIEPVAEIDAIGGVSPVTLGSGVVLSAAKSYDPDGDKLAFQWALLSKPAGSAAAPSSPSESTIRFIPDISGAFDLSLTVTDKAGVTATDSIRIESAKGLISANAGPDVSTELGTPVFVDAFRSVQTQGSPLTAQWRLISAPLGSSAALASGASLNPKETGRQKLTPDLLGIYVLSASLSGGGVSDTDNMVISAGPTANSPPVANAGSGKVIATGDTLTLDASASTDMDGDTLSYRWSIISAPAASTASLSLARSSLVQARSSGSPAPSHSPASSAC